jgi:hypothetical protein
MGERPTIAFRVDAEQKSEWEQYAAEEDEYDSLSHLIRVAVAHEMSDRYGPVGQGGGTDGGGGGEKIGELVTAVDKMQRRLADVEDTVEDATEAAYSGSKVPDDTPTEGELLAALPRGEENAIMTEAVAAEVGATGPALVNWVGLELHHMEEETDAIKSVVDGGGHESFGEAMQSGGSATTTRWYRED